MGSEGLSLMRVLRKPTEMIRARVKQELREILPAETGAPEEALRRVTVLVPASPAIMFTIDHPTPLEAGPNRTYDVPELPPSQVFRFWLRREQKLYAASKSGMGVVSLVVEYSEEQ